MSDPILISNEEDEITLPSRRVRKSRNPTILNLDNDLTTRNQQPGSASTPLLVDEPPLSVTADVTVRKRSFGSGSGVSSRRENKFSGKRVISLESDSEDSPRPGTSNKYAESLLPHCLLESGSSDADSDNSTNWMHGPSFRFSRSKHAIEVDSDQEKEVRSLENKGRQKQNRSSSIASLSVDALPKKRMSKDKQIPTTEEKKLRKEQEKLQKAASKAEDAEHKRLERERKKWVKGKALKSIVAKIDVKLAEASIGGKLILGFIEKGITYRIVSNPIETSIVWTMTLPEDIAQTLPLGSKVPYVLLVFEAEDFCNLVADNRLLENVSRVRDMKKLTRLSVNAYGILMSKNAIDKHLIGNSTWLKVLVTIPKVQPRQAVAISKKYPTLKSLLMVYMDPNISDHEKELLLKDLKVENLGGDTRLGEVCSKRKYRVLMFTSGTMKTDDVENGAASFTTPL